MLNQQPGRALQISSPIELEFVFEGEYFDYVAAHEPEYLAALALIGSSSPAPGAAADFTAGADMHRMPDATTTADEAVGIGAGAINLLHRTWHHDGPGGAPTPQDGACSGASERPPLLETDPSSCLASQQPVQHTSFLLTPEHTS